MRYDTLMILSFFSTLLSVLLLDAVWLGIIMSSFYSSAFGALARRDAHGGLAPIWWPAGIVYLLLALGITLFVLPRTTSILSALGYGALFGLVSYGIYDFTNQATLQGWTTRLSVVDLAWGMIVCGLSTAVAFFVQHHTA